MALFKKLFGGINLTWPKLIVFAVICGIYTAVMATIPIAKDTSFADIAVTFECWLLFGLIIVTNSKSAKDSALKCFVFFLISQPLIYLIQVPFSPLGWQLFNYYPYWFIWTVLTLPIGFVGYYMKKDMWWGALILSPALVVLGLLASGFLRSTIFLFPHHLLSLLLCLFTMYASVLGIFQNKKPRIIGLALNAALTVALFAVAFISPIGYDTVVLTSGGETGVTFDDTYQVTLADPSHGDVSIVFDDGIEDYLVNAKFTRGGETVMILEAPDGTTRSFALDIGLHDCDMTEIK